MHDNNNDLRSYSNIQLLLHSHIFIKLAFLFVDVCDLPCMDVVFALEVSSSIADDTFQTMKNIVGDVINVVNISEDCSRVAVTLFAKDAQINFTLNAHLDGISAQNALAQIQLAHIEDSARDGVNTPAVLDFLREAGQDGRLGLRDDMLHFATVITNSRPNLKPIVQAQANADTHNAATRLHDSQLYEHVYAIGFNDIVENTLQEIADPPSLAFALEDTEQASIDRLENDIVAEFCDGE